MKTWQEVLAEEQVRIEEENRTPLWERVTMYVAASLAALCFVLGVLTAVGVIG